MMLFTQMIAVCTNLAVSEATMTSHADALRHKQVYYGGPCSRGNANVLHACSEVQGAIQIVEVSVLRFLLSCKSQQSCLHGYNKWPCAAQLTSVDNSASH